MPASDCEDLPKGYERSWSLSVPEVVLTGPSHYVPARDEISTSLIRSGELKRGTTSLISVAALQPPLRWGGFLIRNGVHASGRIFVK
ncbi:hypothetical protein TNCV_1441051 [Trichonephila clavipes]|nr:hypothetical protein TNCV_1441051 [Trichonephila clavipes]